MPRLRCPRCAAVVDVAAGAAPSCPSCGFGAKVSATPSAAPAAVAAARPMAYAPPALPVPAAYGPPAYPPPPSAMPPPAGRPPSRTGRNVAIVLVALLVLGGASAATFYFVQKEGSARPLTEAQARDRVAASLDAASGIFRGDDPGGELVKADLTADPPAGASPSGDFLGGVGRMHMVLEWGRDGARKVTMDAANGPVTVSFSMTCTKDRRAVEYAGQAYVSRPYVDGIPDCLDLGGEEEMQNGTAPSLDELKAEDADITVRADGTVHATFTEQDMVGTVDLDAKGRLVSLTAESPTEGTWTSTYAYGTRSALSMPAGAKLMPAEAVVSTGSQEPGHAVYTVESSPQEPPLSEIEVHVLPEGSGFGGFGGFGGSSGSGVAPGTLVFPADASGPRTQGNFTVEFRDADHDGKLSQGDSFTVADSSAPTDDDGFGVWSMPSGAVLYDEAAQGEVNSSPLGAPGLGWLPLAGLALGLAALLRRR